MKKQILILLALLLTVAARAETVEIDGIYYEVITKGKVAMVVSNPNMYTDSVVIPASVTYDGVEYSVTSIGNSAFDGCGGLISVNIPNSVTSIGSNAFKGCSGLTSVTIPNSVTSLKLGAFYGCSGLTSVTIPNSVIEIEDAYYNGFYYGVFQKCSNLTSVIIGNGVTNIGSYAFSNCSRLTSVSIGNSVTKIGERAFQKCNSLASVTIPNNVVSIGEYAFFNCSGLSSVTISENVTSLETGTFANSGLTSVMIPNSVKYIKGGYIYSGNCSGAFYGCKSLKSVTIGDSVISIGDYSFYECKDLTEITIPNSVTSIGEHAFYNCSGLTSVTIGSGVKSIGVWAFYNCSSLTSVHISDFAVWCNMSFGDYSNPLYYAHHLYYGEEEIKDLVIPNNVTTIGGGAFSECSSLTSVTIPNSVTSIGSEAFYNCSSLTSVTIGNSVTSIGYEAFYGCTGLTSVTIPNSVTSIGRYAFYGCSDLTSIKIGSGVKSISEMAFASCKELTDVYCWVETVPSTNSNTFQDSYIEYATLHIPAASAEAYKAKEPWKNFGSIVSLTGEDIPVTPEPQKCATPTISYENGEIVFSCATEGVEYVSDITNADIKKNYDARIALNPTYTISVYATKADYENSDTVTATLTWSDSGLKVDNMTVESTKDNKGDVNGDGVIDVSDYIGVANIILYGTIDGK